MHRPLTLALALMSCAAAAELPDAYAPIVAASNQRRDAAQTILADWKAKRDALTKQWKAVEKKLSAFAPAPDAAPRERLKKLDEDLKALQPAEFTARAQFAEFDRLTDERAALVKALMAEAGARLAAARKKARETKEGAALADEWEALQTQVVAAENEMGFYQARRDSVVRAEGGLMNLLTPKPKPEDPKIETLRLAPPPPADAAERRARFAERTSPAAVSEVGERFFSQMTLTLPGLENVAQLVKDGRHDAALEAYKRHFFAKLLAGNADALTESEDDEENRDGEATLMHTVFPPPTAAEIQSALGGVVTRIVSATKGQVRVEVALGQRLRLRPARLHRRPRMEPCRPLARARHLEHRAQEGQALFQSRLRRPPSPAAQSRTHVGFPASGLHMEGRRPGPDALRARPAETAHPRCDALPRGELERLQKL